MKTEKWWPVIWNYKQPYNNPCVSSMKLKQSVKFNDLPYYSELIYVRFRPNKFILQ